MRLEPVYLGIDVGSVSADFVLLDGREEMRAALYLRTGGRPLAALQQGLAELRSAADGSRVAGVGVTGSARHLVALAVGADLVKNEITAHAVAALRYRPDVQTVLEIGGQDSKIIIIRRGAAVDFAMNTVCAAGTGSFLDHQAARLNIGIEEFGALALKARNPTAIAGRCAVFAESDMIHKQQMGCDLSDIAAGLCEALARNYLNNVGKGKEILPPVVFQGGVAANAGMRAAFRKQLGLEPIVPPHFAVMGALGAALLVREALSGQDRPSAFAGWRLCEEELATTGTNCDGCSNNCAVTAVRRGGRIVGYIGDRCGKWANAVAALDT